MAATSASAPAAPSPAAGVQPRKATNKERQERDALPGLIEALEAEQQRLTTEMHGPEFYKRPAAEIHAVLARMDAIPGELTAAYARWDELDRLR